VLHGRGLGPAGIERPHQLRCERAWSAELAGAPAEDAFTLRLKGPGGTVTQRVAIHVTPLAQNTAPQCQPATEAQRTDGTAPAVVALYVSCWDYEHGTLTIGGGGPGEHLDGPRTLPGGDGGGTDSRSGTTALRPPAARRPPRSGPPTTSARARPTRR
jgi:hypothetical protein